MAIVDKRSLKRSIVSLGEHPLLLISFTLYKVLSTSLLLRPVELPHLIPAFAGKATADVFVFAACAICCILFAVAGRETRLFEQRGYLWCSLGVSLVGALVLLLLLPNTPDRMQPCLFLVGLFLSCGGFCAAHIEFGRILGYLGMTYTLVFNIGCSLVALPFAALVQAVPGNAFAFAVLILAAILTGTLNSSIESLGRSKVYERTETDLSIPWRFMLTSLAQGLAVGVAFSLFNPSFSAYSWISFTGIIIAAVLAFFCALFLRIDFDRLIYRIGFALIGIGFIVSMLTEISAGFEIGGLLIQYVAFMYLDTILWGLGSYLIKNCDQPAVWVAACPSASLLTGRITGTIIGTQLLRETLAPLGSLPYARVLISAIAAYLFMFFALQLSSGENILNGWGFITPNETEKQPADLKRACILVAEDFKLTAREKEVLLLIVQGRSRVEIANELFISQNTVKTHTRKLYTKLEVHSRDDLMSFIEQQRQAFNTHAQSERLQSD